uniref:Sema domain-containing protein n=1 Tax=Denticeps clupeoides TaxID=299321 RepID=A0AAY4BPC8_9TELE
MAFICILLPSILLGATGIQANLTYPRFSSAGTTFQHLALHPDPSVGTIYIGARDRLFQLDGLDGMRLVQEERTGPVWDSKDCLPPVTETSCPHASQVSNHNKLLLVDPYSMELITCGSVHQGTCQKRSLATVSEVLFLAERPVDTQHVAANDPAVSTVGLVVRPRPDAAAVLYVGRGYTGSQPPISTRHLTTEPIFSYEETAKLTVAGRQSEYDHHFVTTFSQEGHIYFLFYRRDLKGVSREYRTYAARVCVDDPAYYSYVEVPLLCHSRASGKNYSLLQAAQVGRRSRVGVDGEWLVGVFSTWVSSSLGPGEESALCVFSLRELDARMDLTRDLCYTHLGVHEDEGEVAYIEYDVKSSCASLPTNTLRAYPCGSDHTPSPMASRVQIEAEPLLDSPDARLTAVAVDMRDDHTVVFLGDSKGNVHKVFLGREGRAQMYATIPILPDSPITPDLILDHEQKHLFIMTSNMVEKRPVSECDSHVDCPSCLASHDPYCGWCILEGRCGLRSECQRGSLQGHWLWSFDGQQPQCLTIALMSPQNASHGEETSVPGLPRLSEGESYTCVFHQLETPAVTQDTTVTCTTPDKSKAPPIGPGDDSVMVRLYLRFLNVTVAMEDFSFYDCGLVQRCTGCVSSQWKCNWCIHQHMCTHKPTCSHGVIIFNQHVSFKEGPSHPADVPSCPSHDYFVFLSFLSTTTQLSLVTPEEKAMVAMTTPPVTPPTMPEPSMVSPPVPTSTVLLPHLVHQSTTITQSNSRGLQPNQTSESKPSSEVEFREQDVEEAVLNNVTLVMVTTKYPFHDQPAVVNPSTGTDAFFTTTQTDPSLVAMAAEFEEDGALPQTDISASSAGAVSSGQGELDDPQHVLPHAHDLDYLSDFDDFFLSENEEFLVISGASACPCIERIQGVSLLPVSVDRKITLTGRNLHLYKDEDLDYECVLAVEEQAVVVDAYVEADEMQPSLFFITCQLHQYSYLALVEEYDARISVRRRNSFLMDSAQDLHVTLYNCSVERSDCSRCLTADTRYDCAWCGGTHPQCVYRHSCPDNTEEICPAPIIHLVEPLSAPIQGGTVITISGSNLGQKAEDIQSSVMVAGVPCHVLLSLYEVSSRIVCETTASEGERSGPVLVEVKGGGLGLSAQKFYYQDPVLSGLFPQKGPIAGGTSLIITGQRLRTGHLAEVTVLVGGVPCFIQDHRIECVTGSSNRTGESGVEVRFSGIERHLQAVHYHYSLNPNITQAAPSRSFISGGRVIRLTGHNLDVVQEPRIQVTLLPLQLRSQKRRKTGRPERRQRRIVPDPGCSEGMLCEIKQFEERCMVNSSSLILCHTPAVGPEACDASVKVEFLLDSLQFSFDAVGGGETFSYEQNPILQPLNQHNPSKPYRHKPGSIISVEGNNLDLAIFKEEVVARIGEDSCGVKTLTRNHLYCEPPSHQPLSLSTKKYEGPESLPEFTVRMGNLNFSLGKVQYDTQGHPTFPLEAQVGVGVGASIVALIVLVIVLIYRRKSKQALRDYKKVQIQLENLETSVRDRCKKEFTDLMTEMMDMSSDLVGSGIPFLDYRTYAERIFFPGHQEPPLRRGLDVQEGRKTTVEQGLVQLSNLLNSKLFLTKFIHTLEVQRNFSPRDRAYVASLLTVALHGKLEYFTDILKTLLNDLVEQYTSRNPKLMLRRTESVVEKLLTNWMSICLYSFLRDSAGESFYMLFKAIKHQVDKGPVDAVTGKAKYTLNDNRLLREDVEYRILTLNVLVSGGSAGEAQTVPTKVLDCDTITQVKEKILEQTWKGTSFSQRPCTDSLHLEWRAGMAGHLILSDEDVTSVVQGSWKRLNTLQHYKVPDGATVTLVPHHSKHIHHDSHDYVPGEKTPMLEDGDEGGVLLWHLVKSSEEPEPKQRRGSLMERERAKAIPEIYLTRLLSVKVQPTHSANTHTHTHTDRQTDRH